MVALLLGTMFLCLALNFPMIVAMVVAPLLVMIFYMPSMDIMLSVQQLDFVNLILKSMLGKTVEDYMGLHEMECSALIEVGNIMISTFINALSGLADIKIDLTVPAFTVDMQGAIMAVPMAAYGGQSDYIMTIGGNFVHDGKAVPCRLLLSPDIRSLNTLLRKLGVSSGD